MRKRDIKYYPPWSVKAILTCKICGQEVPAKILSRKHPICTECLRQKHKNIQSILFGKAWKEIYEVLESGQKARFLQFADGVEKIAERIA